jgi:hypothetical protein
MKKLGNMIPSKVNNLTVMDTKKRKKAQRN